LDKFNYVPCNKFLLHHVSQLKPSKHKNRCLKLFQNYSKKYLKLLEVGTCNNTSFAPIVHQKNMLIEFDNMYMANQRLKMYFIDFFFHPNFFVIYD
jgi:hypothetical protein